MKKKMIAGMMTAILAAGMVMPVSAADTTLQENSVKVGYEEASTFTLTIPAEVTLSETEGAEGSVGLSAMNIETTEKVQIKVTEGIANGEVTLTDAKDSANTCSSTVSLTEGGEGIASDAVIAEFTMDSTSLTAPLYFSSLGEDVPAGTYSGQIVYQASIESK